MAKNTIADLDTTSANNTDILGQSTAGSALANTIDTIVQNSLAVQARAYADYGALGTVGGSANAITLTSTSTYQLLEAGLQVTFKASAANTTAATFNLDGLGARAIRRKGDVALEAGDIASGGLYQLTYDAAYNAAAGAWVLMTPESIGAATTSTLTNKTLTTPTLTLKQSAAPTPTAEGDIQWDTDDNRIVVGDGAAQQIFYPDVTGTFTPAFSATGSTFNYSSQYGSYTRRGNRCAVHIRIALAGSGNTLAANNVSITGLPFANASAQSITLGPVAWSNTAASYVQMTATLASGASSFTLTGITAAGAQSALSITASGGLANGTVIGFNGIYEV